MALRPDDASELLAGGRQERVHHAGNRRRQMPNVRSRNQDSWRYDGTATVQSRCGAAEACFIGHLTRNADLNLSPIPDPSSLEKGGEQYDCTAVSLVRRLVPASYLPMLAQSKPTYPLAPTANGNNKAFLFEMNILRKWSGTC